MLAQDSGYRVTGIAGCKRINQLDGLACQRRLGACRTVTGRYNCSCRGTGDHPPSRD
jgi:hypothetical protein